MKTIAFTTLILGLVLHVHGKEPQLSIDIVKQVVTKTIAEKGIEPKDFSEPSFDPKERIWSCVTLASITHGETFIQVRDSDGASRTFSYSSRKMPEFKTRPSMEGAIRKIRNAR